MSAAIAAIRRGLSMFALATGQTTRQTWACINRHGRIIRERKRESERERETTRERERESDRHAHTHTHTHTERERERD